MFAKTSFLAFFALWTQPFEDEVGTLHFVAFGQRHVRDGKFFEAEGLPATLAVEVDVHVVVFLMVAAVAKLVAHAIAAVFEDMDKVLLPKQGEGTENARLVEGGQRFGQLEKRQRPCGLGQATRHKNAVGRRPDAVLLE